MSVVDLRASLVTSALRRSLLRALLVLGGAFAVTVIGWLFCAGSANADVLPSVPSVPSVLSSVSSDVTAVAPKKIDTVALPDLSAVGRQAHAVVTDLGARVAPSVVPATDLLPRNDLAPLVAQVVPTDTHQVTKQTSPKHTSVTKVVAAKAPTLAAHHVSQAVSRPRRAFVAVVQHRHVSESAAPVRRPASSTSSPVGVRHHSPTAPPAQPASSSDSSAHGGGTVTGGSGGAQLSCAHFVGDGLTMADSSSTPRIAAGPGRAPGTSPD